MLVGGGIGIPERKNNSFAILAQTFSVVKGSPCSSFGSQRKGSPSDHLCAKARLDDAAPETRPLLRPNKLLPMRKLLRCKGSGDPSSHGGSYGGRHGRHSSATARQITRPSPSRHHLPGWAGRCQYKATSAWRRTSPRRP